MGYPVVTARAGLGRLCAFFLPVLCGSILMSARYKRHINLISDLTWFLVWEINHLPSPTNVGIRVGLWEWAPRAAEGIERFLSGREVASQTWSHIRTTREPIKNTCTWPLFLQIPFQVWSEAWGSKLLKVSQAHLMIHHIWKHWYT